MSTQGWEVMRIYPSRLEDEFSGEIAILRKYMPIEEAMPVSRPGKKLIRLCAVMIA